MDIVRFSDTLASAEQLGYWPARRLASKLRWAIDKRLARLETRIEVLAERERGGVAPAPVGLDGPRERRRYLADCASVLAQVLDAGETDTLPDVGQILTDLPADEPDHGRCERSWLVDDLARSLQLLGADLRAEISVAGRRAERGSAFYERKADEAGALLGLVERLLSAL